MSLFYSVVFAQDAPDLKPLVKQVAIEWHTYTEILSQPNNEEVVLQNGELLVALRASDKSDFYELSFGEYHYKKRWHITLGKEDTVAGSSFLLHLVEKVAREFIVDFLVLFNGELVLLKKEAGKLYFNDEADMWSDADSLGIFQGLVSEVVSYPVNY